MEDDRAIELYVQFRQNYQNKHISTIIAPSDLAAGRSLPAYTMMPFDSSATDFLRELSNSTNDFRRWINILAAWRPIYDAVDQDEQLSLITEHITPFSTLAMGAPQALRGRMMYAAATGCSHANYHLHGGDSRLQWLGSGHINMQVASRIGQPWAAWRDLAPILAEMGHGAIAEETGDFRNQREHGHPRNIGLGITTSVQILDNPEGARGWSIRPSYAISLSSIIDLTTAQHAIAVRAYAALQTLLTAQFEALYEIEPSTPTGD